jgi:dUTP pyrophosphatase
MRALSLAAGIKKGLIVCGYRAADISWAEIADSLPAGFAMLLLARSGLSIKQGICLANSVGLIDSDYRGEVQVGLLNTSNVPFTVHDGDRIAQMLLTPVPAFALALQEELDETARGAGGFGSTKV